MTHRIAIDFGTSRTKVAYVPPGGGRPELLRFGEGQDRAYTTSLFYLPQGSETVLFGDAAEEMLFEDPTGIPVTPVKRQLRATNVRVVGRAEPPARLLVGMLRELRTKAGREVAAFGGTAPESVVLTVPAAWGPHERDLLETAAREAGFREIVLLPEPVAAAQAWLAESGKAADRVVVFDCGGGTVDWTYLKREADIFRLTPSCPPGGLEGLGGHDIDLGLLELVEQELAAQGAEASELGARRSRLLAQLRRLKEATARGRDPWPVRVGGASILLTSDDIKDVSRSRFVARAVDGLRAYLERIAKDDARDSPAVLVVGGSAGLPGLADEIVGLGATVLRWDRADFAPVLGALAVAPAEAAATPKRKSPVSTPSGREAASPQPTTATVEKTTPRNEIVVDSSGGGDFTSLIDAVARNPSSRAILVRPGIYRGHLILQSPIEILGDGEPASIVIEGDQNGCITAKAHHVILSRITAIHHGKSSAISVNAGTCIIKECNISAPFGSSVKIYCNASCTLSDSLITNCTDGVIVETGASLVCDATDISKYKYAGILVKEIGSFNVRHSRVHDGRFGVRIDKNGSGSIEDSDIFSNLEVGITSTGCHVIIRKCKIYNNELHGIHFQNSSYYEFHEAGSIIENDLKDIAGTAIFIENRSAIVRRNKIYDGKGCGIVLDESKGSVEENEICRNRSVAVHIIRHKGEFNRNRLFENKGPGLECGAFSGMTGSGNEIYSNQPDLKFERYDEKQAFLRSNNVGRRASISDNISNVKHLVEKVSETRGKRGGLFGFFGKKRDETE